MSKLSIPTSKIEILDLDDEVVHTITDEALEIHVKEILTSGIGTFSFLLPSKIGNTIKFTDIKPHWKAKIYLGYDSLGDGDLVTVGRIQKPTSGSGQSYNRLFEGKNQGEILERRQKVNKHWQSKPVKDIATELANDLGIYGAGVGMDLDDTTPVTLTVRTEMYFDLFRKISDYYPASGSPIKKDFYVNPSNILVWKPRPLRGPEDGVEALTVGENVLGYTFVNGDVLPVKNKITVYGAAGSTHPAGIGDWTEDITDWSGQVQLNSNPTFVKFGTKSIEGVLGAQHVFKRVIPRTTIRHINQLKFWRDTVALTTSFKIRLHAPNDSNYFETSLSTPGSWKLDELSLGPTAEYNADTNPNGIWTPTGSPNWWDLQAIEFDKTSDSPFSSTYVDGLWFLPERYSHIAEGTGSQTAYGLREAEFTDENLLSNSACEIRAKTLRYQLVNPPRRLDVTVKGNTNVKIGDRIPMTIAEEGLSPAVNFDVVAVEHHYVSEPRGFQTIAHMVDSEDTRLLPPTSPLEAIARNMGNLREVASELYSRVVK